ncbi:MAG: type II CAAX endopeptidase family protein [Bacteroidetes bacterium]|nr:type II CAAX endopeptidase family protein [Bacteroidota bacterium]
MKKLRLSVIVILIFITMHYLKYFFGYVIFGKMTWNAMDEDLMLSMVNYSQVAIVLVATWMLFKKAPFGILGIGNGFFSGLLWAFLFTIPMFLGYGFLSDFHLSLSLATVHRDMILAGFYEELVFRGFLFGILFWYCGWGFVPAVLIPSVFFGIGHLYQAETFTQGIAVFLFTALGGAGFAWFYMIWRNLWLVIFLHGFMDLSWSMFSMQGNVTGNLYVNIFRFITIGIVIAFTLRKAIAEKSLSMKGKVWVNSEAK